MVTSGRDGGGGGGGRVGGNNAYGWWKVSQITYIAAIVSFALGGLALIGSLFALTLGHRPEITHEVIPAPGPKDVTTA